MRRLGPGISGAGDRSTADAADRADERLDVIQIRTIGTLAEVVIAALLEEKCSSQLVKVVRKGATFPVPRPDCGFRAIPYTRSDRIRTPIPTFSYTR